MNFFKRNPPKHPQKVQVPHLKFCGEQDGLPEQMLKDRLVQFFRRDRSVQAAYLARIDAGEKMSVALCLKTRFGPDQGLAEKIGAIFKTVFNVQSYLDIMFLTDAQQLELTQVCRPFFEAME